LKERILRKIRGWKEEFLSKAGKENFIRAIAQAILTYAMTCFDLSKSPSDEITQSICHLVVSIR
jgi:hypothetical protein